MDRSRSVGADADAGERHGHGQAHRQDRAEGDDEDDHREREADHLGRGLLELGEVRSPDLHLEAVDLGRRVGDQRARLGGGLAHVVSSGISMSA